jgi:hypothetical protein
MSEVHVGRVDFKNGDPCRPRYVDLYRNQEPQDDPLVQVEPAFQVGESVEKLQVRIELKKGGVVFTDEGGRPLCRELNFPESRPLIEYDGAGGCVLTWVRDAALPATRAFRIYCHRRDQKPTDEEMVYGGIFVAVTTSVSLMRRHIPHDPPAGVKLRDIVVIGTDQAGRPVFDVFKPREETAPPLPFGVELAPAYRARESKPLEFAMTMGIEQASWNGEVDYIQPQKKPPGLIGDYNAGHPKQYQFCWNTPGRGCRSTQPLESCYRGEIVTFHLVPQLDQSAANVPLPPRLAHAGFKNWDDYGAALQMINVDPTIIQPPPCDPVYRVCSD